MDASDQQSNKSRKLFILGVCVIVVGIAAIAWLIQMVHSDVVIRRNPLRHPITVKSISPEGDLIMEDDERVRLAGVSIPDDAKRRIAAAQFLTVAVEHGIEIDERLSDGSVIARGELRVFNTCGNGRIRAWMCQIDLSSWLIASGCAELVDSPSMSHTARLSLQAAMEARKEIATYSSDGSANSSQLDIEPERGMAIGDFLGISGWLSTARRDAGLTVDRCPW